LSRRLAIALAGAGLVGASFVVAPIVAQDMSAEEQKDWLVGFVEGQLSTPERQIRISNIDGVLSEKASIREITISDAEGVWLRVNNAAIDWDQGALFTGRLLVRSLSADSIEYLRNAIPSDAVDLPSPEATPLEVPEFPVAIQLDQLSVPKVTFGENVFGLGSEISIDGKLKLEGGSLDTTLDIVRLDGPGGRLDTSITYRNADQNIDLKLNLVEPPNGILANLLNIEGRPEIALGVSGAGPITDLDTSLTLDAGGTRALEGTAVLTQAAEGLSIDARLGGPIANLIAAPYRPFFGASSEVAATALVRSSGGLDIPAFTLSGGQLSLSGSAATTDDGFLSRLALTGSIADASGGRVTLPVAGAATSIAAARLSVDYGNGGSEDWTAGLALDGFDNGALTAQSVTLTAGGIAANIADPATRRLTFNADGTASGIATDDPDVAAALGSSFGFGLAGLWNAGEPVQIAELRLAGKALTAALKGQVDDNVFAGNISLETSSLAPFSGIAGRELDGAMSLAATGTISPLIGGFNLTLDGSANNLGLGDAALDRLLAGTVALSGRVARTETGLEAENFRLDNERITLTANGTYATGAADFGFTARLADLALLSPDSSGAVELTGTAKGEKTLALDLVATIPTGRLANKPLSDAHFGFAGTLAETGTLAGALSGNATLDGNRVNLAGNVTAYTTTRRLDGLRLEAGSTVLAGDVVQDADGILTGRLNLAAPNVSTAAALLLVDATGSANADIALSASNGTQNATVTARVSDLSAEGVSVGAADLNAEIADLFGAPRGSFTATGSGISAAAISDLGITPFRVNASGSFAGQAVVLSSLSAEGAGGLQLTASGRVPFDGNGLDLTVDGTAPLALGNRFVADRGGQLSGNATLRATVTGSFSDPRLNGTVSTAGSSYIDPELNLRLVDITGNASLAGDRIDIDRLTAALSTGGTASASGSVGISGGNDANIAVRLNSARYADGNLFVATVSGDLAVTGPLQRSPTLSGNLMVERADITIPETLGNSAAIIATEHVNTPAAVRTTLQRAMVDARNGAPLPQTRPSILQLDVNVSAPNQIFVRGRGLDAEVGGSVRLTGPVTDIQPVGGFTLNRGRLAILGQRITFEDGTVTLVGDLDPYLDFTARTDGADVTVYVTVTGRVSDLDIGFTSTPMLPEDEVLSRLLFKRSMGELTPLQLAKLAGAAAELAGGSSSLVDSLRERAGLADLDVITRDDGSLAVQAGAYLQDNVYLGVEAGADGNSRVTVNLDVTDDITAKASTGTDGNDSIGIFYESDY
jgi:translocation and assembly module TamB